MKSLALNGPSGENRTHGLLNPIVLLSKTQCTIRYCLDSVSLNFKCIISFCFIGCQDVSFLLWSNCGQPTLTNDHSPLLSYMAQFRFSKIEIALFCLHELSIRRTCQRCWCTIAIFRPLTGSHGIQLLLRMPRRPLLILPYSKNPHDYGCQGSLTLRGQQNEQATPEIQNFV